MSDIEVHTPDPVQATAKSPGTYYRILDVAEALFARNGVKITSIRTITEQAGVNVAAVNYHFRTKDELVSEVISRRARPLEVERSELLGQLEETCRRENRAARPEEIVSVLISPTFRHLRSGDPGWINFIRFHARLVWEPGTERFSALMASTPMFDRIDALLKSCVPALAEDAALRAWHLQFVRAAAQQTILLMTMFEAGESPHAIATGSALKDLTVDRIERELIAFVAAGLKG